MLLKHFYLLNDIVYYGGFKVPLKILNIFMYSLYYRCLNSIKAFIQRKSHIKHYIHFIIEPF